MVGGMSDAPRDYSMPGQSMADILASIKKIITDETDAAPHAPAVAPVDDDVLELGGTVQPIQPVEPPPVLISTPAREASRAAFASLAGLRIEANAAENTLDGLVREMLRPMLKDWLDANLPDLVERVVAREVARLGGR